MTKRLHRLSARAVAAILHGGGVGKRVSDGGNLYIRGTAWVFLYERHGRQREIGLGSLLSVSLAEAREKAAGCRSKLGKDIDPLDVKEAATAAAKAPKAPTFGDVADMVFAAKSPSWRSAVHAQQWQSSVARFCEPIRDTPIDRIDDMAARSILIPIWLIKPTPASRVRGRCEEIWDYAKVHNWCTGANPFRWKGNLQHVLPRRQKLEQQHLAAMDYRQIPGFLAGLPDSVGRLPLEFLILTATRSAEAREATWGEIDLDAAVWTLPPERMKAGQSHRIPLSTRALEILQAMKAAQTSAFVFPSIKPGRPISEVPIRKLLPPGVTLHGMRSAFRNFCAECTNYPRELAEEALAHRVGNAVERAYRRTDLLEQRRELMEAWAQHCAGSVADNVVSIGAIRR